MSVQQIAEVPVKAHSREDSVLFLWVPVPLIFDAEPIFEAWGFAYKTAFAWDMVKIMARENMKEYATSVSVLHETVRAVAEFLREQPGISGGARRSGKEEADIATFIGWPIGRVQRALAALSDTSVSKPQRCRNR